MNHRRRSGRGLAVACAAVIAFIALPRVSQAAPPESLDRIAINDNRHPAGQLSGGQLTIRLVVRQGVWFPDGPDRPGIVVRAFAVDGQPLQIPGPLLRVPEGTRIRAIVRNELGHESLTVHGLYSRPADDPSVAPVLVPPAAETEFSFDAGTPGTYFYWASTDRAAAINERTAADTQLMGAFVVDPARGAVVNDRIFLIGGWSNVDGGFGVGATSGQRIRWVVNGLSWPSTERLAYRVDETVHFRIINASFGVHPMHLHGFYFTVTSRGDEQRDVAFAANASPRQVVTERLAVGRTFALAWTPTRAGNWLFHCHDSAHLDYGGPLDTLAGPPNDGHHHMGASELEMMSGPVIGISVSGPTPRVTEAPVPRRHLQLVARVGAGSTDLEPAYGYTLGPDAEEPAAVKTYLPGPALVLKRGEPVDVTVVNRLPEPTAVHWHGIELDSYYDGVPGYAGDATRTAPMISPGGSFDALFTPPRSGTFIYHAHMDDRRQQQAGLSGPLIVVDSPESYDPTHDLVLLVTAPRNAVDASRVLVNGSLAAAGRELHVGQHYRVRLINLHTARPNMRMRLVSGSELMRWKSVAKDGMDLPADQVAEGPAEIQMGNGETYDFDFVPMSVGDARFDVRTGNGIGVTVGDGVLLASMPIRIVP